MTYLTDQKQLVSELTNQSGNVGNDGLLQQGEAAHDGCIRGGEATQEHVAVILRSADI